MSPLTIWVELAHARAQGSCWMIAKQRVEKRRVASLLVQHGYLLGTGLGTLRRKSNGSALGPRTCATRFCAESI
jgi:hypothetical protein